MKISYDPKKRDKVLAERGLDFEDAARLFENRFLTADDDRFAYGEARFVTYGRIDGVAIALVWTARDETRRVISMRRMHDKEVLDVGLDRP